MIRATAPREPAIIEQRREVCGIARLSWSASVLETIVRVNEKLGWTEMQWERTERNVILWGIRPRREPW